MKLIYAGTPEFAVAALDALIQSEHQIVAVYTQPDRPAGRGRRLQASPVKQKAQQFDLRIEQPQSLKDPESLSTLQSLQADLMIVAAYGLLLPSAVLTIPKLGCINIHASLLPRWRGAAPIQRAILAGDSETGITLMQMDAGLDTGNMLARVSVPIQQNQTAAALHDELMEAGADLLMRCLPEIEQQVLVPQKQDETQACYAPKLKKEEARIDWNKPAEQLLREVCAYNPWPVSFSLLEGQPVKIWRAELLPESSGSVPGTIFRQTALGIDVQCQQHSLRIKELQFAGKKRITAAQLLSGRQLANLCFEV